MLNHKFIDAAPITVQPRKTQDGYLVAEAFVARAGVQLYRGSEVGMPAQDVVRVWRPESEVTHPESVRGYSHAPVTMGHPTEFVTSDNWASLAKGEVSTEAEWRDGKLRLPLIVKDAAAIASVEAGTRELSAGYTCSLEFADGVTPEGEQYDAIQRNIRINHLAIVPAGRAGSECRIGDGVEQWGVAPITTSDMKGDTMPEALKAVVLGDSVAQVAIADAPAVEAFKAAVRKQLADAETAHTAAMDAANAALAKAEAERDDALAKVLSDADLDKRVADRADLIAKAKAVAPDVKTAGLGDAAIRRAVVEAKFGDAVAGKADAYIDARFDMLVEAGGADPLRQSLKDGAKPQTATDGWDAAMASAGVKVKGA